MAERVIWERTVDHDKIRQRTERFRKRFFIPAAVVLLIVLVFAGWQNAIGALIVVGMVGLTWSTAVRFQSLSDGANPVMVVKNGRLVLGELEIIIEDVKRFTTMATSIQTSLLGRYSRVQLGKAVFRMDVPGTKRDPKLIEFGWPNMDDAGIDTVKAALLPELPDKWVEPHDMIEDDEASTRRRRRRA